MGEAQRIEGRDEARRSSSAGSCRSAGALITAAVASATVIADTIDTASPNYLLGRCRFGGADLMTWWTNMEI